MLKNKKGVIAGVANKRSIGWGVAKSLHQNGAELIFTCQSDRLVEKVKPLVDEEMPGSQILICDASIDSDIDKVAEEIGSQTDHLDFFIHSLAFANKEELEGEYLNTTRDGFQLALDVSAYSLTAMAKALRPLLKNGGSIVAMTYIGSVHVVPGYNIMGVAKAALESSLRYLAYDLGKENIRVNGISAGPVNTLAARGISNFTEMLKIAQERSALKKNTTPDEVGDVAAFLTSDLARGITGEIIYVDNGLHMLGGM